MLSHVVVDLHVEDVCDEIKSILVVLYFRVKASQVEAVCQVVLVDLAEVLITTCCYELGINVSLEPGFRFDTSSICWYGASPLKACRANP